MANPISSYKPPSNWETALQFLKDMKPTPEMGNYWSQSNAEASKADPSVMAGLIRSLNPVTGLGSAMGNVYDAANQGSIPGVVLGGLSGLPVFGKLGLSKAAFINTPVAPVLGKVTQYAVENPLWAKLGASQLKNLAQGTGSDVYNQAVR